MSKNIFRVPDNLLKINERGTYLAYCNYAYHRGVITNETKCRNMSCPHYHKLYFNQINLLHEEKEMKRGGTICFEEKTLEGFIGEDGEVR